MFAISFGLVVEETRKNHPVSVRKTYKDIGKVLAEFGFESMTNLFAAIHSLQSLSWFPLSVRDFRAFRIENWSDVTPLIKGDSASSSDGSSNE